MSRVSKKYYPDAAIIHAVAVSTSWSAAGRSVVNGQVNGATVRWIKRRAEELSLPTDHFLGFAHRIGKAPAVKKPAAVWMTNDQTRTQRIPSRVLRRCLTDMQVEYRCAGCGRTEHNEKPIFLHVDHADGDWKNNEFTNLRYLCGCCHDQEPTSRRGGLKPIRERVRADQTGRYVQMRKVPRPSADQLRHMVWDEPVRTIAARLGVANTTVAKWCRQYEVKCPPRGYWQKKVAGKL